MLSAPLLTLQCLPLATHSLCFLLVFASFASSTSCMRFSDRCSLVFFYVDVFYSVCADYVFYLNWCACFLLLLISYSATQRSHTSWASHVLPSLRPVELVFPSHVRVIVASSWSNPGLSLVMTGIFANDVVSFLRLVTSFQASMLAAALFLYLLFLRAHVLCLDSRLWE